MYTLNQMDFNIFHDKNNVQFVDIINHISRIFGKYLDKEQPYFPQQNQNAPFLVWESDKMRLVCYYEKIEFYFRGYIIDEDKYSSICEKINELLSSLSYNVTRVGIVSNYILDDDVMNYYLKKVDSEIKESREFNFSWLKNVEKDNLNYNIWTYVQFINNEKRLCFDINSMFGEKIGGFKKVAMSCEKIKEEEMNYVL